MVYGSDKKEADKIRLFSRGLLKISQSHNGESLLPPSIDEGDECTVLSERKHCFLGGKI